ncbi:MAG: hypothetical protein ACYCQJ_12255 [Nitrososphaerales archaeon]
MTENPCDFCGTLRDLKDMRYRSVCRDDCCYRIVCDDYCRYECQHCHFENRTYTYRSYYTGYFCDFCYGYNTCSIKWWGNFEKTWCEKCQTDDCKDANALCEEEVESDRQVYWFTAVVLYSDHYLKIKTKRNNSRSTRKLLRFLKICDQLPQELQNLICQKIHRGTTILSRTVEKASKYILATY